MAVIEIMYPQPGPAERVENTVQLRSRAGDLSVTVMAARNTLSSPWATRTARARALKELRAAALKALLLADLLEEDITRQGRGR